MKLTASQVKAIYSITDGNTETLHNVRKFDWSERVQVTIILQGRKYDYFIGKRGGLYESL